MCLLCLLLMYTSNIKTQIFFLFIGRVLFSMQNIVLAAKIHGYRS